MVMMWALMIKSLTLLLASHKCTGVWSVLECLRFPHLLPGLYPPRAKLAIQKYLSQLSDSEQVDIFERVQVCFGSSQKHISVTHEQFFGVCSIYIKTVFLSCHYLFI